MSDFDDLIEDLASAVDDVSSKPFQHFALKNKAPDALRPAGVIFRAILRIDDLEQVKLDSGKSKKWITGTSGQSTSLHVDKSAFGHIRFKKGDRVRCEDDLPDAFYDVLSVNNKHPVRMVLELGRT